MRAASMRTSETDGSRRDPSVTLSFIPVIRRYPDDSTEDSRARATITARGIALFWQNRKKSAVTRGVASDRDDISYMHGGIDRAPAEG